MSLYEYHSVMAMSAASYRLRSLSCSEAENHRSLVAVVTMTATRRCLTTSVCRLDWGVAWDGCGLGWAWPGMGVAWDGRGLIGCGGYSRWLSVYYIWNPMQILYMYIHGLTFLTVCLWSKSISDVIELEMHISFCHVFFNFAICFRDKLNFDLYLHFFKA